MSDKVLTILEDEREIYALHYAEDIPSFIVGTRSVTKIVAYGEPAQYCNVPFFAVYEGDALHARVPAGQVTVSYRTEMK